MAKAKSRGGSGSSASIDEQLARLAALKDNPTTPEMRDQLAQALGSKLNLAAGKAADIVREARLVDLVPNLIRAFDRFMADGADKGCVAKTAIARALDTLEQNEQDIFLRGVRHVQTEPGWPTSIDAAAELRGICAAGLARTNYRDVLWELGHLLADEDAGARIAAARAIAHAQREEGAAILRMKLRIGDPEPAVIGECVLAMLRLVPSKAIVAVRDYANDIGDPALRAAVLVALGESRLQLAFEFLRDQFKSEPSVAKRSEYLLPMALTRRADAMEFLLELLSEQRVPTAIEAVSALAAYRRDSTARAKIEEIVERRAEPELQAAFRKHFPVD